MFIKNPKRNEKAEVDFNKEKEQKKTVKESRQRSTSK